MSAEQAAIRHLRKELERAQMDRDIRKKSSWHLLDPGWAISETMPQKLTLAALRVAITSRRSGLGLLRHSDSGSQHAAQDYRRVLDAHAMRCSMSRKGDCWDDAPMENFFGILKTG